MFGNVKQSSETLPIDIHVFQQGGRCFAFDVRNFAVMAVNKNDAITLSLAATLSLNEIILFCQPEIDAIAIRASYRRITKLLDAGVLSSQSMTTQRQPLFNRLVMMMAGGCNMGCLYCFEKDIPSFQSHNLMKRDTARRTLEWFFRYHEGNKAHIQLYGGEPLLNWPVLKFVVKSAETWANTKNIQLTKYLITNGTLLNSERIKYLKEHSVTIQVSADGDAKTHDQFRRFKSGEPSMDSIRPQIEMLNAIGANFNLRAVLTRQNLSPSHVTEGLRSLGATKVSFEVVATDLPEAHLNGRDWSEFNERYAAYLQVPYSKWLEMPMELQQTIIRICEARKLFYGCGAGKSEVTIGPDGSIYPCQRMYEKPVSHVDEDLGPKGFDKDFLLPVDDSPVCKECWVRYLCGGGCKHVYHMEGNDALPIPDYCKMKINIAESAIAKISEIRLVRSLDEKDNPSNPEDIVGRLDDDYASS